MGDAELIKTLTTQVNNDPSTPVPPGYMKKNMDVPVEKYTAPEGSKESLIISTEILDQLFT